jgi:O-succinylbenzoic acid--CoA ligase
MTEKCLQDWVRESGELPDHRFFRTSGSSGVSKWIALSGEALEWSARSVIKALEITSADVLGLALPEIHVGGFGVVERARISGANLARYSSKWHAGEFASWCALRRVTVTSLVPTQVHDLVSAECPGPKTLRVIVVGGGAFDEQLRKKALALGWPVVPSYGMSETSSQVATGVGLPLLPGWEARLVHGRLALKGGGLLTAIVTEEEWGFGTHDPKVEGWFLTNDLAELTHSGLRILGRADRLVKVLGELVDLDSLETLWRDELEVEVAVLPLPDERRGKTLHLFYEGGEKNLEAFNATFPGPEQVSDWKRLEVLPRSPLGKIDRAALAKFRVE